MNIASYLPKMAREIPFQKAVIFPHGRDAEGRVSYTHYTFFQLNEEADRYAYGLQDIGLKKNYLQYIVDFTTGKNLVKAKMDNFFRWEIVLTRWPAWYA